MFFAGAPVTFLHGGLVPCRAVVPCPRVCAGFSVPCSQIDGVAGPSQNGKIGGRPGRPQRSSAEQRIPKLLTFACRFPGISAGKRKQF